MTPLGFWERVEALTEKIIRKLAAPFRAKATSVNASGVQIQTYDSDSPLGERYPKLNGPQVNSGDEVAVIPYGGSNLVLGAVGDGPIEFNNAITNRGSALQPEDHRGTSTSTSLVSSTTSTTTYQNALVLNWTLPAGTWFVSAVGGLNTNHSAPTGAISLRLVVHGEAGSGSTGYTYDGNWGTTPASFQGNIVSTGSGVIALEYRAAIIGTVNARSPWFLAIARRIA